ncbi:VOC family protein [Desertimonas flava]|jgi:predicted lactoylglutathione lyase|uniref:VOC family protein n=1 Tax=Desertimonas flava TaxID=2064846 RepID=UPI000E348590|nr:VOC family protein [Desertimonas flava]
MSVTHLFVNLPVADIAASKAFYEALGFSLNPQFSDESSAYVVLSETAALQLSTLEQFQTYTDRPLPRSSGVINALGVDSRDEVDRIADTALLSGGSPTKEATDLGWLYNRGFADPDGHHFEVVHVDMSAIPA